MINQDHLFNFFNTAFNEYDDEKNKVNDTITKILLFFSEYLLNADLDNNVLNGFPYSLSEKKDFEPNSPYSFSTNAMVLNTLYNGFAIFPPNEKTFDELKKCLDSYTDILFHQIINSMNSIKGDLCSSGTWGDNDPITLQRAASLLNLLHPSEGSNTRDILIFDKKVQCLDLKTFRQNFFDKARFFYLNDRPFDQSTESKMNRSGTSLLVSLCIDRLKYLLNQSIDSHYDKYDSILYRQIAYSSIPDERFDPAQLAFALEGMILTRIKNPPSLSTVIKVLETLETAQNSNAFWRPMEPVIYTEMGYVLLPASIEVANSLLCTWTKLREYNFSSRITPLFWKLLTRYTTWLFSQGIQFQWRQINVFGWEAENIGKDRKIHLWQTSEILSFLLSWRELLNDLIAKESLKASGLYSEPKAKAEISKDEFIGKNEPLPDFPKELQVATQLWHKFIEPRKAQKVAENYSFLLYGPPGTGKTTLAKKLARALKFAFVVVTPGDFTAGGEDEIESRIKNIFKCIQLQQDTVVLFDEMDQFLLDRDSSIFRKQTSILQFLTNGMLTKIADLRQSKSCIFIIATNYAERIDPAIKRKGRMDFEYCLMPPSWQARAKIIDDFFDDFLSREGIDLSNKGVSKEDIIHRTALCSYKEIETFLAHQNFSNYPGGNQQKVYQPRGYKRRFIEYQKDHNGDNSTNDYMASFSDLSLITAFPESLFIEMVLTAALMNQSAPEMPDKFGNSDIFDLGASANALFDKLYQDFLKQYKN